MLRQPFAFGVANVGHLGDMVLVNVTESEDRSRHELRLQNLWDYWLHHLPAIELAATFERDVI